MAKGSGSGGAGRGGGAAVGARQAAGKAALTEQRNMRIGYARRLARLGKAELVERAMNMSWPRPAPTEEQLRAMGTRELRNAIIDRAFPVLRED